MEIWDILDEEGNKTGRTMQKGEKVPKGYYHTGADIWFINSENKILIQKRSPLKRQSPNVWAMTGGSVEKGETSLQTIERETMEELGIQLNMEKVQFIKHYRTGEIWLDTHLVRQDIDLKDITMKEDEVSEVKWATYEEIEELVKQNQFLENRWEYVKEVIKAVRYLGKEVEARIDRPMGSSHPKYPGLIYQVNYGFVPNTMSGDGEELDCYVLGEEGPLTNYTGKCIAVIHRLKEDDDKLILVPTNKSYTVQEIKALTAFVEKNFESVIIM